MPGLSSKSVLFGMFFLNKPKKQGSSLSSIVEWHHICSHLLLNRLNFFNHFHRRWDRHSSRNQSTDFCHQSLKFDIDASLGNQVRTFRHLHPRSEIVIVLSEDTIADSISRTIPHLHDSEIFIFVVFTKFALDFFTAFCGPGIIKVCELDLVSFDLKTTLECTLLEITLLADWNPYFDVVEEPSFGFMISDMGTRIIAAE